MAKRSKKQSKARRGQGWEFIPVNRPTKVVARHRSEPPEQQRIKVREERRKDKVVTVARGFALTEADLQALAKRLKTTCGAGGTAKEDAVEVQGAHRQKVLDLLLEAGFKASS